MEKFLLYTLNRTSPKLSADILEHTRLINTEFELNQTLNDPDAAFLGCILKFDIISPELVNGTRVLRSKKPLIPAFVWSTPDYNATAEVQNSLSRLTFSGFVTEQTTLSHFLEQIRVGRTKFMTIGQDTGNADVLHQESAKTDDHFFPIRLVDLILGKVSFFDVYIRLSKDKYVKLMNKGETADLKQLERYREKGVKELFLLKEQQSKFLEFCDYISGATLKSSSVKPDLKLNQALQFGDQILRNFELQGVTSENIRFAGDFLNRGIELVRDLTHSGKRRSDIISHALEEFEHTTALAILGGMLTRALGYTSPDKINTISLALLLHEVGTLELPEHLRKVHDPRSLSPEDREAYCQHPKLGHELLADVPSISDTVRQAVLHHHERRDRSGFPAQLSGNSINFVAEIIGICDEYLCFLEKDPKGHQKFIRALDEVYKLKFSPQIIKAFKEVFRHH